MYPNPCTTSGRNTEKAVLGTLAQMLKTRTYQSFQSLAVSTTSLLVRLRLPPFTDPTTSSTPILRAANSLSPAAAARNQADPGPAGSQAQATRAKRQVRAPSMTKRYCQGLGRRRGGGPGRMRKAP